MVFLIVRVHWWKVQIHWKQIASAKGCSKLLKDDKILCHFHQNWRNYFKEHSQLLGYIRNQFLPICDSSRGYHFLIHFDENSATNVIASLLQMDEIKRCSKVKIGIEIDNGILHLPIEEISNWLERYIDGIENKVQNRDVRFFKFGFYDIQIQNCREMIEHLIMVFCI